jgi:hypothetical protein
MKRISLLFVWFFSTSVLSQSYILSGKVSDANDALPFANIYAKGTTLGVNSNDDGKYNLKLAAGTYTIVYQYVGYSKKEVQVTLNENKVLNVNLTPDAISLKEVVVKAGEDPSYPIIRKAIKRKKYFASQVNDYSCQSYIKGLQRLKNIPERIKKLIKFTSGEKIDSTDLGVIYLSESESNYYFRKPDKQKEIMYSSRVSGESRSFSFNQLHQMKFDFNDNLITIRGISARPFVSPLNGNAFFYYKYILLGTVTEDGKVFNKIKVIPKRKNDPCFSGIIYIQEDQWRLTGVDLQLTKDQKLNFVDTLTIRQMFAPVLNDSIWLPVNYYFGFSFQIMGITGDGYFNAIVKNYNLNPAIPDKFFNNEILIVEEGANKKDSAYWNAHRAAPLTKEELIDYRKKDSTEKITESDHYKDSVDAQRNKFRVGDLLNGYTYTRTKNQFRLSIPGIITSGVQYNTVEGLNLSYYFSMTKEYENFKSHRLNGKVRYGVSNYLFGGDLGYNYFFNPKKFSRLGIRVQSIVEQFNKSEPITPLINSAYSLLTNENFIKLYKESGVELSHFTELTNGLFVTSNLNYHHREPLRNSSDLLLIDNPNKLFTSNDPLHPNTHDSLFSSHNILSAEISVAVRFRQKYITVPGQKIITGSKYPRISFSYRKAIPVLNAIADYDLLSGTVYDQINLGLFGKMNYRVRSGMFLNTNRMFFMDYKHFIGNQTLFITNNYLNSYRLLPYYTYSADRWFIEAHAEHHFNSFILNKIPVLKKIKAAEVVGVHYLSNNKINHYYEINFGLENIFQILRFDYVLGYGIGNKVNQGFTIGINTRF